MARMAVQTRRHLLVEAAIRVIADAGVEAATTRAICAEAAMSLASVHYAFPSRGVLLEAVLAECLDRESDVVRSSIESVDPATPETVVTAALHTYVDGIAAAPARERAAIALSAYGRTTPGQHNWAAMIYDHFYRRAANVLTLAAQRVGVRWTAPIDDLTALTVALTDGLAAAYLSTNDLGRAHRTADLAARALLAAAGPVTERVATR